jgi:hypothetical protein
MSFICEKLCAVGQDWLQWSSQFYWWQTDSALQMTSGQYKWLLVWDTYKFSICCTVVQVIEWDVKISLHFIQIVCLNAEPFSNNWCDYQGFTGLRCQVAVVWKFCVVAPNICGSVVWNLLPVTLLAHRIWKWLLDFFEHLCNLDDNTVWTHKSQFSKRLCKF